MTHSPVPAVTINEHGWPLCGRCHTPTSRWDSESHQYVHPECLVEWWANAHRIEQSSVIVACEMPPPDDDDPDHLRSRGVYTRANQERHATRQ